MCIPTDVGDGCGTNVGLWRTQSPSVDSIRVTGLGIFTIILQITKIRRFKIPLKKIRRHLLIVFLVLSIQLYDCHRSVTPSQ